jgi:hypothetical protein
LPSVLLFLGVAIHKTRVADHIVVVVVPLDDNVRMEERQFLPTPVTPHFEGPSELII